MESGRQSRGHRFLAPNPFDVKGVDDYLAQVAAARVVVDPGARKAEVIRVVREAASGVSGEVVLMPKGTYRLELNLATRPGASSELEQALGMLGRPGAGGKRRVTYSGRLPL